MHVAFLFNSDDPKYNCVYGDPIRDLVFGFGIIQKSKRHMKVAIGDVLIFSHSNSWSEYDDLTEKVYFSGRWSDLLRPRLEATFRKATVYALVFQNITKEIALKIHRELTVDGSYLGLLQIDLAYAPHLIFFRNFMIEIYRVEGESCHIFYAMGEEDARDVSQEEAMRNLGYNNVDWEDRGAHKTIFDNFDTLEHFQRVAIFHDTMALHLQSGADDASQLVMILEDLNPKLFDALGAAVQAIRKAQTAEDVAQAAMSGRRYIEQLSEVLFPPRTETYKGRKVGQAEYLNRIWAYVANHVGDDADELQTLGKEATRLVKEFNAGLHSDRKKETIVKA